MEETYRGLYNKTFYRTVLATFPNFGQFFPNLLVTLVALDKHSLDIEKESKQSFIAQASEMVGNICSKPLELKKAV